MISNVERLSWMFGIGGIALGALLAWLIGRAIANPIKGMTDAMTQLAGGNLKVEVPAVGNKDEIGEMAKAVLVFRDAAIDKVRMEREAEEERVRSEAARKKAEEEAIGRERAMVSTSIGAGMAKLAAKDLTFRLTDDLPEAYRKLQADFNAALEQLEQALQGVSSSTQAMNSGTQEISTASNDLSRRTEQQASSLEETAAALDEITATVKKAAEGATHARKVVAGTKEDAERSGEVVRKAVEAMGGNREVVAADRPDHRRDRRDRLPDQPAGAQRRRGGGACGRCGPRLRGGRLRGAGTRPALGGSRQGDQGA